MSRVLSAVVDRRRFEELVGQAVDCLPGCVLERVENMKMVEDRPPADESNLSHTTMEVFRLSPRVFA